MFAALLFAVVADFLFLVAFVHDFALLPGGEHGRESPVYASFGKSQGGGVFIAAFFQNTVVILQLGRLASGAAAGQMIAEVLPACVKLLLNRGKPLDGLLTREEGPRIIVHRVLFLALTQDADRFEGKMKCFHGRL